MEAIDQRSGTASTTHVWRADIQGLRALAVVLVVTNHAGLPVPGGFVGVDVFFVISGFVICGLLVRELETRGAVDVKRFYRRRFLRLTPALGAMVGVVAFLSFAILSPLGTQQTTGSTGIAAMLLVANFVIARQVGDYFGPAADMNPLLHTWSLSLEEQYYLAFPALLIGAWFFGRRRGRQLPLALAALAFLTAGSLALAVMPQAVGYYSPFPRIWEFSIGALAFLASKRHPRWQGAPGIATAGFILILIAAFAFGTTTPFPSVWTTVPVLGTALVLVGSRPDSPVTRLLSSRAAIWTGDRSYSLYLWHWPLIVFAFALLPGVPLVGVLAAAISVPVAMASYSRIEQPLRHWSGSNRRMLTAIVPCAVGVPIVICLGLLFSSTQGYWNADVRAMQARMVPTLTERLGCTGGFLPLPDPETCVRNASSEGRPVYLVGDSSAGQFAEALDGAATFLGRPAFLYTYGGCPLGFPVSVNGREFRPGCSDYRASVDTWLASTEPGTVVLSNAEFYLRDPQMEAFGSGVPRGSYLREFESAMVGLIERLQSYGHHVVVIQPVPNFRLDDDGASAKRWASTRDCPMMRMLTSSCGSIAPDSMESIASRQGGAWRAWDQASRVTGAALADSRPVVCPQGVCAVQRDGLAIYRDYLHISPQASAGLAEWLAGIIDDRDPDSVPESGDPRRLPHDLKR